MQSLSVDIETKVLNDLDEKIHRMAEMLVSKPDLIKLLAKARESEPHEVVFAFYILYMCSHAFHMRQRRVLSDNEWAGWLRWMTTAFREGTIHEYWKERVEPEKWFDPAFQDFIDKEIIPKSKIMTGEVK